jgi:hypothetical protein
MVNKLAAVLLICVGMLWLALSGSWAQEANAPFHISTCSAAATCCIVPMPLSTVPVPGGTPTTVSQGSSILYGAHVSNQNAASEYMQFFNSATQPTLGAIPLGASSWIINGTQDRDLSIGELRGMAFTSGIAACCSTTQGTFTAVGNCGFLLQYY